MAIGTDVVAFLAATAADEAATRMTSTFDRTSPRGLLPLSGDRRGEGAGQRGQQEAAAVHAATIGAEYGKVNPRQQRDSNGVAGGDLRGRARLTESRLRLGGGTLTATVDRLLTERFGDRLDTVLAQCAAHARAAVVHDAQDRRAVARQHGSIRLAGLRRMAHGPRCSAAAGGEGMTATPRAGCHFIPDLAWLRGQQLLDAVRQRVKDPACEVDLLRGGQELPTAPLEDKGLIGLWVPREAAPLPKYLDRASQVLWRDAK